MDYGSPRGQIEFVGSDLSYLLGGFVLGDGCLLGLLGDLLHLSVHGLDHLVGLSVDGLGNEGSDLQWDYRNQ